LLSSGAFVEFAGALLDEPAVLYKEKVNYKLPGGAGYAPHQDAPAYPMIDVHVSAMVAVDDADQSNGGLEIVSRCFDTVLPQDERGCIAQSVVEQLDWQPCRCTRAGAVVPQPHAASQRAQPLSSSPPPCTPLTTQLGKATNGVAYYATKRPRSRGTDRRPRRVSLIGDFEGRAL
jgi:hypothetical protein